ncbi:MAG: DUF4391 domain-containing protein [Muribaculaceae bacterium]|nr:DUF4391 domain-containing protein [Muribaculaceae bacterium]
MLGLPQSTEVKRPLPKAQLYKRFDWKPSQRECFDGYVSHLDFVNWIAPRTLPAIAEGVEVKEIFVIEVSLKSRDFDQKSIVLLAKSIPQRVIYLLRFEDEAMLAVYHSKLFTGPWQSLDSTTIELSGLNLDAVWQSIVSSIGQFSVEQKNSLTEQIKANEERAKIEREIAALERQMNATKQPRRKRELFLELTKLKSKSNWYEINI